MILLLALSGLCTIFFVNLSLHYFIDRDAGLSILTIVIAYINCLFSIRLIEMLYLK